MLQYVMVGLIALSTLLFIISFFQKDRVKELEEQMEQFTLSTMQDLYQIKKRLKAIEEELLVSVEQLEATSRTEQVWQLYKQGWTTEQIARQFNIPTDEVNIFVQRMIARNER